MNPPPPGASAEVRPASRTELIQALEQHLRARGFPRAQMIFIVAVAGGAAFLCSAITLRLGLDHMGVRYGLASLAGYLAFVGMVRAWIAWQRGHLEDALDAVDVVDVIDSANAFGPDLVSAPGPGPGLMTGGRSGGGGMSAAWSNDGPELAGPSTGVSKGGGWSLDIDDAWPLVVAAICVVLGALAVFYTIWIAPVLLAEVALDAALVTTVYRRMRKADAGSWIGATLRRTWLAGAALVLFMTVAGTTMTLVAPEARSIGGVIRALRFGEVGAAGVVGPAGALGPGALGPGSQLPAYEAWAVRFARAPYALSSLVAGAERGPRIDIAFTVWPLRDPPSQRIVLVDAGFYRDKFLAQWKPLDYVRPDRALEAALGIAPDHVSDIIVTHSHWDHADGVDLFPNAVVWIQKAEYEYYVGPNGEVLNRGGVDADDARMLAAVKASGRLRLIDGEQEILPGIRVYLGGKHTFASQYVGVRTGRGTLVIASDNAYLYRNLDQKRAIAQTLDAVSNLAAQARMIELAGDPSRVIPGHDPEVFTRFAAIQPGVARLAPAR